MVGCLAIIFPEILGTGYGWVELALAGKLSLGVLLLVLLLKAPAMGLTVGSGGSGGIFGPTVVMGAMLGGVIGTALQTLVPSTDFSIASFVVVGMAAVFSGAARTPISTLIMVAEMTGGYGLIVPAMLANALAFVVQRSLSSRLRYPTLYQSQVNSREDSPAHRVAVMRDQEMLLPRGPTILQSGDQLLAVVTPSAYGRLQALARPEDHPRKPQDSERT